MTCILGNAVALIRPQNSIGFFSRISLVPNPTTGLSSAPVVVTVLTKEVNLMALHKGIRTHQTCILRLASELAEIRTGSQTGRQLRRFPVRPMSASSSKMVAGGQCASRSTITPTKTCSANLYTHIKKGGAPT